jgi:hypothetical protein
LSTLQNSTAGQASSGTQWAAARKKEAPPGFEPGMSDLQSDALATWLRRPELVTPNDARRGDSSVIAGHASTLVGLAKFVLSFRPEPVDDLLKS